MLGDYVGKTDGKYFVLGIDKFDYEDWLHGKYETAEKALEDARKETDRAKGYASGSSIATVYYAYTPEGRYLGGDTWKENDSLSGRESLSSALSSILDLAKSKLEIILDEK